MVNRRELNQTRTRPILRGLERLQEQVELDPRREAAVEIGLAADGAGLRVRQVLHRKLEAEGRTLP